MQIIDYDDRYFDRAVCLAQKNYERERRDVSGLADKNLETFFRTALTQLFKSGFCKMAVKDNELIGYLAFDTIFKADSIGTLGAFSPLWGYGIKGDCNRAVIISKLFIKAAELLCENYAQSLRVNVYAHDKEVLHEYSMSAFAMDMTEVIMETKIDLEYASTADAYDYKEMKKSEILIHKNELLELYRGLINHLRFSPVFYNCNCFLPLEERYTDFLSDDMRIFAVFDRNKLIGMLDAEVTDSVFAAQQDKIIGMGDVFINKAYRGKGISAALLQFAKEELKKSGIKRICVTHGTINPTARGFWDKYFTNYSYTMTRRVDSTMLGKLEEIS